MKNSSIFQSNHRDKTYKNIVLGLAIDKRPLLSLARDLKNAMVSALANYTLMSLHGDEDSIYGTAWRLHRARTLLLLSRP